MQNNIDDIAEIVYREKKVHDFIVNKLVPLIEQEKMSDFDIALMAQSVLKVCFQNFSKNIKENKESSVMTVGVCSGYFLGVLNDYYNFTHEIKESNLLPLLAVLEMESAEYKKRIEFINKIRDEIYG